MSVGYREGDWFAIPLEGGGYGLVLIARARANVSVVLGYFFGPRHQQVPSLVAAADLSAADAVMIKRFGDSAMLPVDSGGGGWVALGHLATWDRTAWPMPVFMRKEPDVFGGRTFLVQYPDDNPNGMPSEEQVQPHEALGSPDDGMNGHSRVAKELDKLLG